MDNPYEKALCTHPNKNSSNHVHTHACVEVGSEAWAEGWKYPEIPTEPIYYVLETLSGFQFVVKANPQPTVFPSFPRRWPAIVGALLLGLILGGLSMAYTLAHIWLD